MQYTNPTNSQSYTNKDFRSIFEEQLEVASKLTDKWDPSQSNESDPGVVLLKENAIIGDKLSYNMDTNILELFPGTVKQENVARNLFAQLGYNMHWYQAATGELSFTFGSFVDDSESTITHFEIPAFSTFSNNENTIIFTTTDTTLGTENSTVVVDAIQGIPEIYELNGSSVLTLNNLDANNRLYFTGFDIAENGIFVVNTSSGFNKSNYWTKVNNLATQPLNSKIFKFGVEGNTNNCYIEFPEDVSTLIEDGLSIVFIRTLGASGNVPIHTISKINNIPDTSQDTYQKPTNSNLRISNISAKSFGENPEDISTAYKNYEKTIGVFNTLVTLRDYENYLYLSDIVSNAKVFDRTNDPNNSILVKHKQSAEASDITTDKYAIGKMSAFDLKLLAFQYVSPNSISNNIDYNNSFKLKYTNSDDTGVTPDISDYLANSKSCQHDFIPLGFNFDGSATGETSFNLLYILNKLNLNIKVLTSTKLSSIQEAELRRTIINNLYAHFNCHELSFGVKITYNDIYDTIVNSSTLIKAIFLDELNYHPYACIYQNNTTELIDLESNSTTAQAIQNDIHVKSILAGTTPFIQHKSGIKVIPGSSDSILIDNIDNTKTPAVSIPITYTGSTEFVLTADTTIPQNESMRLVKPEYAAKTSYTLFKYKWFSLDNSNPANIPANVEYTLSQNQRLLLFMRENDSTSQFTCVQFDEGATIKANFEMICYQNISEDGSNPLDRYIGETNSELTASPVHEFLITSDVNDALKNYYTTAASGSNELLLLDLDEKLLYNSSGSNILTDYKFYWITSDTSDTDSYSITFKRYTLSAPFMYEYTLKETDQFLVSNKDESILNIYGYGTLIKIISNTNVGESITLSTVGKVTLNELDKYGYNAFTPNKPWVTSTDLENLNLGITQISRINQSIINFNEGDKIESVKSLDELETSISVTSANYVNLNNITTLKIRRQGSQQSETINIPQAGDSPSTNNYWQAKMVLYLNCGPDSQQSLTGNQTITITKDDAETTLLAGQALQTYPAISNVDVTEAVTIPEYLSPSALVTTINTANEESRSYSIPATAGLIIPVYYDVASSNNKIEIKNTADMSEADYEVLGNIDESNWVYILINNSTDAEKNIIVSAPVESDPNKTFPDKTYPAVITIMLDADKLNSIRDISTKIDTLTTGTKQSFDYSSTPALDQYIENPLSGESFFDPNHVYNSITLPNVVINNIYELHNYLSLAGAVPSINFTSIGR